MAILPTKNAHCALYYLTPRERFRFFVLRDARGPYAAAALAEHPDALEVHLEVLRFGPGVVRALRKDVEELRRMARERGKSRVIGLRLEPGARPDPRWAKFTRLLGFTGQRLYQAAELLVG